MTVTTVAPQKSISKMVGGKTVTMTPEQAEAFGRELDALKERVIGDLGERDAIYIDAGPFEDPRQHGDRPQRHARPVRLDG
jgi:hypothetical protein